MTSKSAGRAPRGAVLLAGLVALAALALVCVLAALGPGRGRRVEDRAFLVVSDGSGEELAEIALPDGRFEHVYVHSFHLTPVRELFRVEAGKGGAILRLYELRYQSSGVGMPEGPELGYSLEDGVFVVKMDRSFASIPLRVSILAGHGIEEGGRFHPFTEWAAPERALVLRAEIRKVIASGGRGI